MIFNYRITDNKTIFNYEIENETEMSGMGETQILTLLNKKGEVYFNYPVKNPHNDIMAFIIIIIFNPFIKDTITFKFNISDNFINNFKKINEFKEIKFINTHVENIPKFDGNNISISLGGGCDSTAIMYLFNDAFLYHQLDKEKVNINLIAKKCRCTKNVDIVDTNIKRFITPLSYTHWISVFIGIYLLAQDQKHGYIFLGTIISVFYIKNNKFVNSSNNSNFYSYKNLSKDLGIEHISVFRGCSEIISTKIIAHPLLNEIKKHVRYCDHGHNNQPCHKCDKCFRKNIELSFFDKNYSYNYFSKYNNIKKRIKSIKNTNMLHILLYKNSNYYKKICPEIIELTDQYNYQTDWADKIYTKAYNKHPNHIKKQILDKLHFFINDMNDEDIYNFENYDANLENSNANLGKIEYFNKNHNSIIKLKTYNKKNIIYKILLFILLIYLLNK